MFVSTAAALLIPVFLLAGCHTGYLVRVAYEQARFLMRARPISELLQDSSDPQRAARLRLVLEVRTFADSVGVDPGGSYLEVSDTAEAAPFHVVTAAYPDRLQAYTWDYPIVGSLPYRGYFDRDQADRFAAGLAEDGLDIRVVSAAAYSTLGWFDDPLPSSLLEEDEDELVGVVLHELVHQNFFVAGHVAFNETLATAVSFRLTARFFRERGQVEQADAVGRKYARWLEHGAFLDALAVRLRAYFEQCRQHSCTPEEMLEGRAELYANARRDYRERFGDASGVAQGEAPLDNARFLAIYRYATRADLFEPLVARYQPKALFEYLLRATDGAEDPYRAVQEAHGADLAIAALPY